MELEQRSKCAQPSEYHCFERSDIAKKRRIQGRANARLQPGGLSLSERHLRRRNIIEAAWFFVLARPFGKVGARRRRLEWGQG